MTEGLYKCRKNYCILGTGVPTSTIEKIFSCWVPLSRYGCICILCSYEVEKWNLSLPPFPYETSLFPFLPFFLSNSLLPLLKINEINKREPCRDKKFFSYPPVRFHHGTNYLSSSVNEISLSTIGVYDILHTRTIKNKRNPSSTLRIMNNNFTVIRIHYNTNTRGLGKMKKLYGLIHPSHRELSLLPTSFGFTKRGLQISFNHDLNSGIWSPT